MSIEVEKERRATRRAIILAQDLVALEESANGRNSEAYSKALEMLRELSPRHK